MTDASPTCLHSLITGLAPPGDTTINYSVGSKGPSVTNKGIVLTGDVPRVLRLPSQELEQTPASVLIKANSSPCTSLSSETLILQDVSRAKGLTQSLVQKGCEHSVHEALAVDFIPPRGTLRVSALQ